MPDDRHRPSHRDVQPVRDLVTDEEAHEAMHLLDTTYAKVAKLQTDREYYAYMIGAAEAVGGLHSDERSADKRKWEARSGQYYLDQIKAWREATQAFFELKARREGATLKIDIWRTIHADKRARQEDAWQDSRSRGAR
jgi:hypothetical protein